MYIITTPNGKTTLTTKEAADIYTDALNRLRIDHIIRYTKEKEAMETFFDLYLGES